MIGQWIAEECDIEPGNRWKRSTSAELFAAWNAYAQHAGENPGSRKAFAAQLELRGFENKRGTGGVAGFLGIRLKPRSDASDG